MNHKGTIFIETERLILRRFTENDVEAMFRNWEGDPKVTEFLRWKTAANLKDAENVLLEWIRDYEKADFYQWAIVLKELEEPIGTISVVDKNEQLDIVHIGFCIGIKLWHQGITSEAFKAIIPFFFNEVCVNRIESQHDHNNPNSGYVMKKCGLKYEGTLRESDWNNQGVVDACMYSLLKSEWKWNLQRRGKRHDIKK